MNHHLDEHTATIGASGSGKTTTARGRVEQALREKRHTLITDHTGVWWGLRAGADGKSPGFDIPIFGGRRGDVAISPADGAAIARIIVEQQVSAIVDVSLMTSGADQRIFMADLVAGLRAKPPGHFQFFADEADEIVPEKVRDDAGFRLQENMIWIAKRGRSAGFVLSLITQRTADVAKAALSQCQTIFAHQLLAPTDLAAFRAYVKDHGTKQELAELMAALPTLQVGERFVYSPRNHILEHGRSAMPATFDSMATPPPGKRRREPKMLAELDVSKIRKALQSHATPAAEAAPAGIPFTAGAATSEIEDMRGQLQAMQERALSAEQLLSSMHMATGNVEVALRELGEIWGLVDTIRFSVDQHLTANGWEPPATPAHESTPEEFGLVSGRGEGEAEGIKAPAPASPDPAVLSPPPPDAGIPPRQQKILDAIAWCSAVFRKRDVSRDVLAIVLKTHPRTKGFLNDLGSLRTAGLIHSPVKSRLALTGTGWALAHHPQAREANPVALRREIYAWLPPAQRALLDTVVSSYPEARDRDDIAESLQIHPRTKTLLNNIGRLKTLGLLTAPTPGTLRAADFMFGKE